VPYNAPIFEFCRKANTGAIRRLLILGHASLDDVNEIGETPLHVSLTQALTIFVSLGLGRCWILPS
jgi:hypothetical protein